MNHGGLGMIDENASMMLPPEFIEHLCMKNESMMYCMYYPPKPDYPPSSIKHDFVITPIPFKWWDRSARIIMHLKQESGSLKCITDILAREDILVSILHSESTRSAHRYATYSMHIAFTNLPEMGASDFQKEGEYYKPTEEALKRLVALLRECPSVFVDKNSSDIAEDRSIIGYINSELNYFHHEKTTMKNPAYAVFSMKVEQSAACYNLTSSTFTRFAESSHAEILDSVLFIEFDPRMLTMRAAVLPKEKNRSNFYELGITYKKDNIINIDGVGVTNEILSFVSHNWNIYRSYNFFINEMEGGIVMLIEYINGHDENAAKFAKRLTEDICDSPFVAKIQITNAMATEVNTLKVRVRLKKVAEKRVKYANDVFISVAASDADEVEQKVYKKLLDHKLVTSIYTKDNRMGEDLNDNIRINLLNSREICVVISKKSLRSSWVQTEWGAAWFLGKKITPILMPDVDWKDVKETRLITLLGFKINDENGLQKFIADLVRRKSIDELDEFDSKFY